VIAGQPSHLSKKKKKTKKKKDDGERFDSIENSGPPANIVF